MFGVFVPVLPLLALVYAFIGSLRCRFVLGAIGAVVRVGLLVVDAMTVLGIRGVTYPGSSADGPLGAERVALATVVIGPAISFGVLLVAWLRARNVPARQEEAARRPVASWLPAAIFDALYVFINVLAWIMTRNM